MTILFLLFNLYAFFSLPCMAKISGTTLNRSSDCRYPCVIPMNRATLPIFYH